MNLPNRFPVETIMPVRPAGFTSWWNNASSSWCIWNASSHQLPVASCELPVASWWNKNASCQLRVASCQLPDTDVSDLLSSITSYTSYTSILALTSDSVCRVQLVIIGNQLAFFRKIFYNFQLTTGKIMCNWRVTGKIMCNWWATGNWRNRNPRLNITVCCGVPEWRKSKNNENFHRQCAKSQS